MKILQVNATIYTGSIGRNTYELAIALEEIGHESYVAFSSGKDYGLRSYRLGTKFDHKIHALLSRITGLQGYFSRIATKKFLSYIDSIKPDVVHLNNLHSNYINLSILLNYLADHQIPTVITLHDCWFFTGKCPYPIRVNCEKFKSSCGRFPLWKIDRLNPSWFFDTTHKCFMDKKRWFSHIKNLTVIGVSNWVTQVAKQSFLEKANVMTIYNWIDLEIFKNRESNFRKKLKLEGKFVLLFVSSYLAEHKGYTVICQLANFLPDNWAIVAIGREVKPLPKSIIHIEHTNDAVELAQYYSMADVCVNCTQYETFGKVTAEAISCGTPVIVYNNTASPELVGEGCGYIVDQKNGISAILEKAEIIQKTGKKQYSNKCRDFALNMFSKEKAVTEHIKLYESMIVR